MDKLKMVDGSVLRGTERAMQAAAEAREWKRQYSLDRFMYGGWVSSCRIAFAWNRRFNKAWRTQAGREKLDHIFYYVFNADTRLGSPVLGRRSK